MIISERLRALRDAGKLSQKDIEKRSGLSQGHISLVESGYKIPTVETLERWMRALDVPLYQLFYEPDNSSFSPQSETTHSDAEMSWGSSRTEVLTLQRLRSFLSRMSEEDRQLLLRLASELAAFRASHPKKTAS
jgi:transcriptional regulator with XRE-family HTH domain